MLTSMHRHFDVIDCDSGRGWSLVDEANAVRYAAAQHAATGHVIEVVQVEATSAVQVIVLPPHAPEARPGPWPPEPR